VLVRVGAGMNTDPDWRMSPWSNEWLARPEPQPLGAAAGAARGRAIHEQGWHRPGAQGHPGSS